MTSMWLKRLKPAYLIFLILPVVGYFLISKNEVTTGVPGTDYLCFSVKSEKPVLLELSGGTTAQVSWNLAPSGYKMLDYAGNLSDSTGLTLTLKNVQPGDTLSFLSFNFFRNGNVSSLYDLSPETCKVTNALVIHEEGETRIAVQKPDIPVTLILPPVRTWTHSPTEKNFLWFTGILFLLAFVFVILLAPPVRYFIVICIASLSVMILAEWAGHDSPAKVEVRTKNTVNRSEIYYSRIPQFTHLKRISSESSGNVLAGNIDIATDPFLRFDIEKTLLLNRMQLTVKKGMFRTAWDPGSHDNRKLVLNDMEISDGTFIATGKDPFVSMVSDEFISELKWLNFLDKNTFLFVSLICFFILLMLHLLIGKYVTLQFKWVYLLFLGLPALWYYLSPGPVKEQSGRPDYFYYSARATKPALISLFTDKDSVASWEVRSDGYKQIDCLANLNDSNGLILKVRNLTPADTISFLAFNFFRGQTLYSLYDRSYPYCIAENAWTSCKKGVISLVPQRPELPVTLHLSKISSWQQMQQEERFPGIVTFAFLLAFLMLLIMRPPARYVVTVCLVTAAIMGLFSWLGRDVQDQVTMETSTPQGSVETYYSQTPVFHTEDKFPSKTFRYYFRTQVELGRYQYFRCDVDDSLKLLKDFRIGVKTGLIGKTWELDKVPQGKLVLNDLRFERDGYRICGNDPYFALTTTYLADPVRRIITVRQQAFLLISLFIFLLLMLFSGYAAKHKPGKIFLLVFFLAVISNGLLFLPFNSDRVRLITEKRDADTIPAFYADSLTRYTGKVERYLGDQVNGRNRIIPFNNYFYYSLFGELLNNPNVYFGKDGWMFYVGANGRETYENRRPVTPEQLRRIQYLFEERRDWLQERGIKLYIIFPRVSQFIYEDKIGGRMFRYHQVSKLDQLMDYLNANSDLNIIDVGKPLLEARKTTDQVLYYKRATHWNYYGAYFAYAAVINRLREDFPQIPAPLPLEALQWNRYEEPRKDMDLIQMSALVGYITGQEIKPLHPELYAGDTVEREFPQGKPDFPVLFVENPGSRGPAMVMFRDSYAKYLYPYLGRHFSKSAYFWTPAFNTALVEKEKPALVIWEINERFIPNYVIRNNPPFSRAEMEAECYGDRTLRLPCLTLEKFW